MEIDWQVLPDLRREASASALFACMEQQRDPGLSWQCLDAMDPYLLTLLPLRRSTVRRRTREGLEVLDSIRFFEPALASALLREIRYTDFMQDLVERGYDYTKDKFIRLCCEAASAHQFSSHYER